jgi:hypothetical protein
MENIRLESYQKEIKDHLQYLGVWDKLEAGKCKCFVCKTKLTKDNFGLAFRDGENMETTCNQLDCIRKVTTVLKD